MEWTKPAVWADKHGITHLSLGDVLVPDDVEPEELEKVLNVVIDLVEDMVQDDIQPSFKGEVRTYDDSDYTVILDGSSGIGWEQFDPYSDSGE